jgi:VanZ family protein
MSASLSMTPARPPWRALLLLCAAAIAYGSLHPFRFTAPASFDMAWSAFLADGRLWTSRGDVVGNIALFVPLGALALAALPRRGAVAWTLLLLAAVAFAFVVQVLQIWFPPREPSLADVLWNGLGSLVGMAMAALALERFGGKRVRLGDGAPVAAFLLLGWLLTQLFPFLPSLDWQMVKDKLKPLLADPAWSGTAMLFTMARVLAAGCLLQALSRSAASATARLALLLGALLVGKLLVVGQSLGLSMLLGFGGGWIAWALLSRWAEQQLHLLAFAFLLIAFTLVNLMPFELRDIAAVFHWVPFDALLHGSMVVNSWALVESVFIYCTLLWLVAQDGGRVPGSSVVLAVWVGGLEAAQVWIEGRTGDITAPLLVLLSGFVVHRLVAADTSR